MRVAIPPYMLSLTRTFLENILRDQQRRDRPADAEHQVRDDLRSLFLRDLPGRNQADPKPTLVFAAPSQSKRPAATI